MQIANSEDDLSCVESSHWFFESTFLIKEIEEFSSLDESHYKENLLIILENVVHGD